MALAGDLKTFFITTILQLLHNNVKTGVLRVWCEYDEVRIFFNGAQALMNNPMEILSL